MWKSWQAVFFASILVIVMTSCSIHPAISDSQIDNWMIHWVKGKYYLPNYKLAYQVFKIPYQITNASIEKIDVPDQSGGPFAGGSVVVDIVSKGDGILKIQMPRNLPFSNSGDNRPSIFVDGQYPSGSTQESQTTCFMEFTIPFTANNKEIEFFGTQLLSDSQGPVRGADVPVECIIVPPPKQQLENGILPQNVTCSQNQVLVKRIIDNSPACVKPDTAQKLVERGWGVLSPNNSTITLKEGERDGPLLVQKIYADHITGLNYKMECKMLHWPPETSLPVTLRIGESANDEFGQHDLTLIKIQNNTAILLKTTHTPKPCTLT